MKPTRVLTVFIGLLGLTACGAPDEPDIEQVAKEARSLVNQLAAEVGADPEVRQDTITDCVPGDKESGKDLIYILHVDVGPDAPRLLRETVAPSYEVDGWTAKFRGDDNLQLRRDNVTMGVTVFAAQGQAAVSGTGGCVR